MYNLAKLTEIFKDFGLTVGVYDFNDVYNYHQVYNADKIIKEISNEIKRYDNSPLEKLMQAYFVASRNRYTKEDESESIALSRSVYGVLNSDKIVCAGFVALLNSIVNEFEDENVKAFSNDVATKNEAGEVEMHRNNIVYLKDEKYDIDGYYYLDPTWDSSIDMTTGEEFCDGLRYFLIEISQIKNINDEIIDANTGNKLIDNQKTDKCYKIAIGKIKNNNLCNLNFETYSSVSKDGVDLNYGGYTGYDFKAVEKNKDYITDNILAKFLIENKDFKEYLAMKQMEKDLKKNKKSDFDKIFTKNLKKSEKKVSSLKVASNKSIVWEYLSEHSPHISVGILQKAMHRVFKNMYDGNKDEISQVAYLTLKNNIQESKFCFNQNSQTSLSECENLK